MLGASYSISISIVIYFVGNLMFSEWLSFPFFLIISIVPSIVVFFIFRSLKTIRGSFILVLYSLLLGLFVSFLTLLMSTFLDNTFNERNYWDISTFEGLIWCLSFSIIGSILFIPISFMFLKLNNRLTV